MKITALVSRILFILLSALIAFFWATGLIDSLYAYRSPLHDTPPAASMPLLQPGEPRSGRQLVFILLDGLRLDSASDPSIMPTLAKLRSQGAWASMRSQPPSFSQPGYTTLLTGAWPDINDSPAINLDFEQIPGFTQDDLFSAAHRAGLSTAISAYYWFEKLIPQTTVNASFYTPGEDQFADRQVVDAALPWLRAASYQLVLIHIDQIDYAGHHEGGPLDARCAQAARRSDELLGEIIAAMDLERDALFITSDHGHILSGGHGGHESDVLLEPFLLAGAGVRPGNYPEVQMVDVAPTLATMLGANIPASAQGQVLTNMLDLPQPLLAALPIAVRLQQERLLAAYGSAIGVSGQANIALARQQRLQSERLPRYFLAGLLALLPLYWLFRRQPAVRAWLLGSALLYVLFFNLRYALLDQRTYSLSSLVSADEIILYAALTAGVALLISWGVYSLSIGLFRLPRSRAASHSLDLILGILFLLALTVLWSYALNGLFVTWTLPHFPSMFLAFLSLIQILLLAPFGLLLTALTAFAARSNS